MLGSGGLEQVACPAETLHEIITNALLHRDYAVQDDVHVRVFDNRIEVDSPVAFRDVTPRNILDERFARNPATVKDQQVPECTKQGRRGRTQHRVPAMRALRLREPEIFEKNPRSLSLSGTNRSASPEEQIMEYLGSNDEISNRKRENSLESALRIASRESFRR